MGGRCAFYIDGFNLYHSLRPSQRWLDLQKLSSLFIAKGDRIVSVKYFTSYCPWDINKENKHRILTSVYCDLGITVILGKFKKVTRHCRSVVPGCTGDYKTHEEKQTDVNIALHLLNDAWKDHFDKAFIISGDTDLLPPIRMICSDFAGKKVKVIFPPNKYADEIKQTCLTEKIKKSHLEAAIMVSPYTAADGTIYTAPDGWL